MTDRLGNVSLWKGEGGKLPVLRGNFVAHRNIREGETIDIAVWRNQSDNEKAPYLTGKVQDRWVPKDKPGTQSREEYGRGPQSAAQVADDFDDDIPFS